jgi:hypothetical protein
MSHEIVIRLVHDDMDGGRKGLKEGIDVLPLREASGRVVRVADVNEPCARIDSFAHRAEVVGVVLGKGDVDGL